MSKIIENKIYSVLKDVVADIGFELIGVEYIGAKKNSILRIYIDKDAGVNIDDCVEVSQQISPILDVEDIITTEYNLEVSSPGLDRPLFTIEQYQKYIGDNIEILLILPSENQRKWQGLLTKAENNFITIVTKDNLEKVFTFSNIKKCNLIPNF